MDSYALAAHVDVMLPIVRSESWRLVCKWPPVAIIDIASVGPSCSLSSMMICCGCGVRVYFDWVMWHSCWFWRSGLSYVRVWSTTTDMNCSINVLWLGLPHHILEGVLVWQSSASKRLCLGAPNGLVLTITGSAIYKGMPWEKGRF